MAQNQNQETMKWIYPATITTEEERKAYERRGRIVAQRIAPIIDADLSESLIYGPFGFNFSLKINEAEHTVERIKRALPRWAAIEFTGNGDFDDEGKEYTEVSVVWEIQ